MIRMRIGIVFMPTRIRIWIGINMEIRIRIRIHNTDFFQAYGYERAMSPTSLYEVEPPQPSLVNIQYVQTLKKTCYQKKILVFQQV